MSDSLIGPGPTALRSSSGRRPRGVVRIDGKGVAFTSFTVESKGHFSADTFSVDIQCWNQPQGFGLPYWADAAPGVTLQILMGFLDPSQDVGAIPDDLTPLIMGEIDDISPSLRIGKITLSGRDLSARLIDSKTTNKWPDQTASQIATNLAAENGLAANVTPTTTPVGQYLNNAYANLTRDIPEWDLLVFLANQEGFDLYVSGQTLFFNPMATDDPNPLAVTVSHDQNGRFWSNATEVRPKRSLTLAQDISVTVLSHGVWSGSVVKAVATRAGSKAVSTSASKAAERSQNFIIRRPNLTQEQAQKLAEQMAADFSAHERTLEVTMEGDPALTARRMMRLSGTDTSFDTGYYIDRISRSFRFGGGFAMTVHGKNHPITSDIQI